jgi:molecular chaperone GrpE
VPDERFTPDDQHEVAVSEEEAAASELEADLARLSQLQSERDEYLDTLRRVQAEFENYRKRVIKEQTALVDRATSGLVEQLLPVLDSFELALKNLDSAGSDDIESVRKGVELVYAELLGVLEKAGLSRIEAEGKPFDPNVHEAVMQEDGDGEPVVTDVLRTGYTLKGRVLRPAMVKVSR